MKFLSLYVCTTSVYPSYSTFLKNLSTAFLVSKMGETVPKAFLKLRFIISTICFYRKTSYLPELLRKLKISVRFIIPFSLSCFFKLAHYICLVSVFWHFMSLSDTINENISEITTDIVLQILKWKNFPRD